MNAVARNERMGGTSLETTRASEQRLRLALAASRAAVWEWKRETDELRWAPESFAVAEGAVFCRTGREFIERVHPGDRARVTRVIARAIEGHVVMGEEYRFRDNHHRWLWMANYGQAERAADGTAIGLAGIVRDIDDRRQAEHALQQLSGRLLQAQDEERRRLARELHDVTAQELATLCLNLDVLLARSARGTAASQSLLADCRALARQCADEVRTFTYLLHPPLLDALGVPGAVRDYIDGFAARSGIRMELELPADLRRLPREIELTLFRVLQESLANIRRHSGSPTASVRVAQSASYTRLEVRDWGRGLDVQPTEGGTTKLGVGILGMRERLRQLNGTLVIESAEPGVRVIATVPHTDHFES